MNSLISPSSDLYNTLRGVKRKIVGFIRELPFVFLTIFPLYPKYLLLGNKERIYHNGKFLFKVASLGRISSWRVKTFSAKEPETLRWIDGFSPKDIFFDIGANIGLYSLYAACKNVRTFSFEPSAQNYALLNLNIDLNSFDSMVTAYPLSCHESTKLSQINISSMEWASALSSFDNNLDQHGKPYKPVFGQGSIGMSLDQIISLLDVHPTHLKIDVDGNELYVLKGSVKALGSPELNSVLIELNPNRLDYGETLDFMKSFGFILDSTQEFSEFVDSSTPYNCIFVRKA